MSTERRGAIPSQREQRKPKVDPDAPRWERPEVFRFESFRELSILLPKGIVLQGNSVRVEPVVITRHHKGSNHHHTDKPTSPNADRELKRPMLRVTPVVKVLLDYSPFGDGGGMSREALHRARKNLRAQEIATQTNRRLSHNGSENQPWPNSAKARLKPRDRFVQTVYMEVGSRSKRRIPVIGEQPVYVEGEASLSDPEIKRLKDEMTYLSKLRGHPAHRRIN